MADNYIDLPLEGGGGVTSLNGLAGALTLVAGSGITITPAGSNITIAATGAGFVPTSRLINTTAPLAGGGSLAADRTLSIPKATTLIDGYLSAIDWTTFNNKQNALTFGNLTDAGTDGIVITGGTGAVIGSGTSIAQHVADSTHNGYLSNTDWSTFNSKQAAGNYITDLTGDATASGPGSAALTLATVNGNVGSFGTASNVGSFTVNGKGLITAASNTAIQIAESQVTNLVSDLAGKQATGNYLTALTGDGTASGPGSAAFTLATVNSNVGTFGSTTSIPIFTVNGKGLITAASQQTTSIPTTAGPSTIQMFTVLNEDWVSGALGGSYGWTATTATGTVTMNTANIDATHWGIVALTSGTASANAALISLGAASRIQFGSATVYAELAINLSALSVQATSNYVFRAGFIDNWTGLPNNGIWFDYNTATSANWVYSTANGGARTQTASATAVATGWVKLGFLITTTSVNFLVNGVSIGTQSTNFPSTAPCWPGIGITKAAVGAANTTALIDYFSMYASWGSAR